MTEFTQPEQAIPPELQQPTPLTDDETAAVLHAVAAYEAATVDAEGQQVFDRKIMGMTYDGMVVMQDSLAAERRDAVVDALDIDQLLDIESGVLDTTQLPEDMQRGLGQPANVYRIGHISELVTTGVLPEQVVSLYDSLKDSSGLAFRGSGSSEQTAFGTISYAPSEVGDTAVDRLPRLDDKLIFPIGADGRPYAPTGV